jgi:nitrite reductase (NADH) small subunit
MPAFVKVAELSDIPPGSLKGVVANGKGIALANVNGTIYAMDEFCPHRGAPLYEGTLDGEWVECPWHAWKFHLGTGECSLNSMILPVYQVKVVGNDIWVST